MKFRIKLRDAHRNKGVTFYRVSKETGLAPNTPRKYADVDYVDSEYIPVTVVTLCQFYGVDWRDPKIIEVVDDTVN